jgi:ABC-2 type transport system permease protein
MEVRRVLRHSAWICWKDLLEFGRSKMRLVMLVLMPLFMMVMVGYIFPSGTSISNQPVGLANQDTGITLTLPPANTSQTMNLGSLFVTELQAINNKTGMMDLRPASGFDDIKGQIQDGAINGGIIISADFSQCLMSGEQGNVTIVTDQSNPQMSAMMETVLSQTIGAMGKQWAMYNLNQTFHISISKANALIQPYNVQFTGIVPGSSNYFEFIAPGITCMVVMMSLMTGLPHAISYEKDMGTLDGMLVAPTSRLSIILGKVLAQTVRGIVQAAIIFALAVLLFGVVIYGSLLLVVALIFLTVFSFVGLGILITSFTDREETATMVMMTLMFPMMFLSGVFFPIQQMPWFMQDIAHILPLTYATTAMRKVMVLGAPISAVLTEITVLLGFGVVLLAVAVPMFRKAMTR